MPVAGLPEVDSLSSYGGPMANLQPVEDPTTDEDSAWRNLYAMNVAAMTQTAARAMRSFVGHATTPADPASGFVHAAVWGSASFLKPTVVHFGLGIYDLTWPTTVSDELAVVHTVNFRRVLPTIEANGDGLFRHALAIITGPNTVRVVTYLGTALDNVVGQIVTVWVY